MGHFLISVLGMLAFASIILALPLTARKNPARKFLGGFFKSFFAVVLPLVWFFLSGYLLPDCKHDCVWGWLDCFWAGKMALTPLALLASAALYSLDVLQLEPRSHKWIPVGIFLGMVVSVVCLVHGIVYTFLRPAYMFGLPVPIYITFWYVQRFFDLVTKSGIEIKKCMPGLAWSLPLWIFSIFWSQRVYASLPDYPPSCFIVTAAGRGHRKLVGPHFEVEHNGRQARANQQLITLWQFERHWRTHAPLSHKHFRRWYNHIGPAVAARINSPWLADLVYLAIKPVELAAQLALSINNDSKNER